MRTRLFGWLVVLIAGATACPTPAHAQAAVFGPCVSYVPALTSMSFDDATHLAWYRRFWNGECSGLFGCLVAHKWSEVVDRLASEASPAQRHDVVAEACSLGRLVGYEWARDNNIRHITTSDLQHLSHILEGPGDPAAHIAQVRTQAQALLAGH